MKAPPINLLCHPIQEGYEFLLYIQALIKSQKMNKHYRNHAADRRANSLKLNPRPPQTNSFRHFHVSDKKATDLDLADHDRMNTLLKIKNRRAYK
jgi:hypothetical protein